MVKIVIAKLAERLRKEKGQALIVVLVLLMIGSLTLPPVLSHISTALKTGKAYDNKTNELYAADSGIEDAIWQIKYDRLGVLFSDPEYDIYDFDNTWSYSLDEPINGLTTDVTIQNIWIPKGVEHIDPAEARDMIESNKLMVAGTASGQTGYKIKINFTPGEGEENSLEVESLGIWLPLGFTYVAGSSNLEVAPSSENLTVAVTPYFGGQAVVWTYDPPLPFTSLPGVSVLDVPMTTEITFDYTASKPGTSPVAIAWMVTDGVVDVPLSWDIDTRIYKITSVVGDTEIEAYSAKCELRKMGAAIAGDYRAIGNSLMRDTDHDSHGVRDQLLAESFTEVSDIPESADVVAAYLYWSGWFAHGTTTTIFSDTCSNFNNWDRSSSGGNQTRVPTADGDISGTWNTLPCWDDIDETTPNDTDYMTGTTDTGGYKLFSFSPFSIPAGSPITDLTVYVRAKDVSNGTNDIRPSIKVNGTRYNTTATSNNPGTSFTTYSYSYTTNPKTGLEWVAEDLNGTGANPLQQFGVYSSDLNPDIQVSMVYAQVNYASDSRWSVSSNQFRGQGSGSATTVQRTLTLKNSVDLSSYASGTVTVSWDQDESGTLESGDTLYFAISGDGGSTWSSNMEAFHDDNPSSSFSYTIPDAYLRNNFKIRFYFNFNDTAEYVYLDNIKIIQNVFVSDTSVVFKINDTQVYLDAQGNPHTGSVELTAGESQVLENQPGEYSYACHRDVTRLVKTYSDLGDGENHTGNAKYTVGGVSADTGSEWSYAGWSLIIIYSSPETAGHQLYLYDEFAFNHGNENLDFDNDGQPGGDIKSFFVPEPIAGEVNAAGLTVFVGEGDNCYTGDYLQFNGTSLSDGYSTSNVWNSKSIGMSEDGVDIDTFHVTWASNLLEPGDTTAHIDMPSGTDNWNLIYIILSLRSETVTGGTTHYVIHGR